MPAVIMMTANTIAAVTDNAMICTELSTLADPTTTDRKAKSMYILRADCINATQISTQLSPLSLLSLPKSSLKQISLYETNAVLI